MGRTRLRGIEIAGIRVVVEAPETFPWSPTAQRLSAFTCAPHEPDVYVGMRVARSSFPCRDAVAYATETRTFEIGRDGEDWVIAVHGRTRCERVARFDASMSQGEVLIRPEIAAEMLECGGYPLSHPLDELLVLHRVARSGGLVLQASAVWRDGRALVFANSRGRMDHVGAAADPFGGDRVVLRMEEGAGRLLPVPWNYRPGSPTRPVLVDTIHSVVDAPAVCTERLYEDDAVDELLGHVFAPVHDPDGAACMAATAEVVGRNVPVVRLGLPEEGRVVPFTWGHRRAALAFAPAHG